jgi:hypothetical protein
LCQRGRGAKTVECPHFQDCEYIRSWRGASDAPFVILVHAYLGLGRDTDSYAELTAGFDYDNERDDGSLLNPVEVANIVCDEDRTQIRVE